MMANKFLNAYQCQDKLTQSLTEEEKQNLGPTDILFKALDPPEYSGRVRPYGKGVSKKRLYPPTSNNTQAQFNNLFAITSALAKKVENYNEIKAKLDWLEKLQANEITGRQQPEKMAERQQPEKMAERQQSEDVLERPQQSAKDSYNPVDIDSIPKVIQNLCFLLFCIS
jgi:hypothetical protein